MKTHSRWALRLAAFLLCIPLALQSVQASTRDGHDNDDEDILTQDHFVPHISTVPANKGEAVELFVRERVKADDDNGIQKRHSKPVVLMVHGAATPTVPVFDVRFENYSWMAFLAKAGFDVFAMDLTGYGRSPRPMMDNPCNTSRANQEAFLIPNPLDEPCEPEYAFKLSTVQSDWDEIDTVVDYLRDLRQVDRVNLLGWSNGGVRTGGYAARHGEKVDRLFLYAPANYNRTGPSDPPAVLPEPGVPMTVTGSAAFFNLWDTQVKCPDQFTPAIRDPLRSTDLEFDELGSTWGSEGVRRQPVQNTFWGWNKKFAGQVDVPTLIIRGDLDTVAPELQMRNLFEDIQTQQKVFVHVACGSHMLVWENQHEIMLRASLEWLSQGTFAGQQTGSFFVDTDGEVHPE